MVKLPVKCKACGAENYFYGTCPCSRVETGCGCIFCDLGLEPDVEIDTVKFHHVIRRGNILCERKVDPEPGFAFLYTPK